MPRPRSEDTFHVYDNPASPRWWIWWYDVNGKRKRKATRFEKIRYTREHAQMELNRASGITDTDNLDSSQLMSTGWFKQYMLDRLEQEGKKEGTVNLYRNAFDHLIEVYGDAFSITGMRKDAEWRIKSYLLGKGDKNTTVNKILRHLHAAFQRLVKNELIDKNPLANWERLPETNNKIRSMSHEEILRFLEVIEQSKNQDGKRLAKIAVFTGLRLQEILLLDRDEIDLENHRFKALNIKHSEHRKRWLGIPKVIEDDFRYFLTTYRSDTPMKRCHPDTFSHWIKEWLREADLGHFRAHDLRHTFATLTLKNGTSIRALQRWLDHSDTSVTEIYAHDIDSLNALDIGL